MAVGVASAAYETCWLHAVNTTAARLRITTILRPYFLKIMDSPLFFLLKYLFEMVAHDV
jgi:hypothetical protein